MTTKHIMLIAFLLCAFIAKAQRFDYIDTKGYSIHSVFKDSKGILWLGTNDGIMSYAQLLSQSPNGFKRSPQLNGLIVSIEEDRLGRLLLKLQSNKYMIYSPKENKLIKKVDQYLQQAGIPIKYDFNLTTDSSGNYWIGGKKKLYIFNPKDKKVRHTTMPQQAGDIIAIHAKNPQNAIVACEKEMYLINKGNLSPIKLCHLPEAYNFQYFYIQTDSKGNIWMASPAKLHRFDIKQKTWRNYEQSMFDIAPIRMLPDDQLLVPTSNTGVFIFDNNGNEAKHLLPSPLTGLINKHVLYAYYDTDYENIWLTYHKQGLAVAYYSTKNYRLRTLPSINDQTANDIIALAESQDHQLWMGTEDNGAFCISLPNADDYHILSNQHTNKTIVSMLCDSKGRTWTGLYRLGLHCSDGYNYFKGFSPYCLTEAPNGDIYVSLMGLGLWKIDHATRKSVLVENENLWLMQCVTQGDMLYTASPKFIHCINMRTGKKRHIPGSVFGNSNFNAGCKSLCIDSRGWLWINNYSSYSETEIYDTRHNKFFTTNALKGYVVNSVVEDKEGNLWFGTTNGIVRLKVEDTKQHRFSTYCYLYGTQKNQYYNERCAIRLSDGRLLFGATDGFMLFNPQEITHTQVKKKQPCLIFTSLRINSEYINPKPVDTKNTLCVGDFPFVKTLDLKYNENNLVLEFCPRNEMHNSFENYYYKIEGISQEWMPLSNYQIVLSNLQPGTYHLLIREQPTQQLSESIEYEALTITVHPPFWLSPYAYLLYIGLTIGLFYLLYRYFTNRRRYLEKMRMIRLQAKHEQEMNDMKLQFFTNVSHDLRTPLTLIITPLEELLNTVGDMKMQNILSTMLRNAKRLFFLVNQILDIRALDASAVKVITTQQDVIELLRREYQSFQSIANSKRMNFHFEANVESLVIETDVDKVTKMVENLLSNAFKYTDNGGTIVLSAHQQDKNLQISVSDTGKGISGEDKKNIFEQFYMGKESNRKESSGIGLSIVKQFAQQLGGSVSVSDNKPKGSIFRITLPVQSVTEAKGNKSTQQEVTDGEKKTLLVVEDNIDLLQYLSSTLSETYHVYQATDGRQALEILKATEVNLIVSDVMMAGMDGMTLCKNVKKNIETSHIPVILLTAKSLEQDELEGLQMGASDYITKPFSMEILRLRIKAQLERVSIAQRNFKEKVDVSPSEVTITTLDQQLLSACIAFVEQHIDKASLSPEELASGVNLSRTTLYKKLRSITGDTPVEFIRILRLKRAKQLLEQDHLYVAEVAARVGFNNPKIFSRYFHDEFGIYPSEVEQKKQD